MNRQEAGVISSNALLSSKPRRSSQDEAQLFVRPDRCCGFCAVSEFYQGATILIVLFDLILAAMVIYLIVLYGWGTESSDFQPEFVSKTSHKQRGQVENYYVLITLPINFFLFYKAYVGIRWVLRRCIRPAMQTYYLASWTFYTAYVVQTSFILFFTWDVFNDEFRVMILLSVLICFPLWVLLTLYMKYLDDQNK